MVLAPFQPIVPAVPSVWDEASLGYLPNTSDPSQPASSYAALTNIS
jgi:hypothetical protein